MKMQTFHLFPTQVTHYRNFLSGDEINSLTHFCMSHEASSHNMLTGNGMCSSGSERPLNYNDNILEGFNEVSNKLDKSLNEYAKAVGIQSVKLTNSWFNIQEKGSITKQHNHPFSVVSAALFINCPAGSNPLYFENPNPHIEFNYRLDEKERSNSLHEYWYFVPESGDLIIFPSWLKHGSMYTENNCLNRIVISMNTVRK